MMALSGASDTSGNTVHCKKKVNDFPVTNQTLSSRE
jgi:hypothetical protein